jgi:hypothetical protein
MYYVVYKLVAGAVAVAEWAAEKARWPCAQAAAAGGGGEGPLFHGPAVAAVRACVSSGAGDARPVSAACRDH